MKEDKINVNVTDQHSELIIRHGEALPPEKRESVHLKGSIEAPAEFIAKRGAAINPLNTHVFIDRDKGKIKFVTNEESEFQTTVVGQLEIDKHFQAFRINNGDWSSAKELGEFLRRNRRFISNAEEGTKFINSLLKFKAKVEKEIERSTDNRGNNTDMVAQKVISEIPKVITLDMPIIKGLKKEKFKVEIFFDVRGASLSISLDSIEAEEIEEKLKETEIKKQLGAFEDYATIYV